jgi:DNA-3-methyladenine glycosylase I
VTAPKRDQKTRCGWAGDDPLYVAYHDKEWGVPEWDDRALYEKLVLDGFQAGLAWITILRKRENFRSAFRGFDPEKVARFGARDLARLMADAGIVRNRAKVEGAVKSARAYLELKEKKSDFAPFLWGFVDGKTQDGKRRKLADIPAESDASRAMSKALKERGFAFCGPTICYAFMQAVGMVNDHLVSCFRHGRV